MRGQSSVLSCSEIENKDGKSTDVQKTRTFYDNISVEVIFLLYIIGVGEWSVFCQLYFK